MSPRTKVAPPSAQTDVEQAFPWLINGETRVPHLRGQPSPLEETPSSIPRVDQSDNIWPPQGSVSVTARIFGLGWAPRLMWVCLLRVPPSLWQRGKKEADSMLGSPNPQKRTPPRDSHLPGSQAQRDVLPPQPPATCGSNEWLRAEVGPMGELLPANEKETEMGSSERTVL